MLIDLTLKITPAMANQARQNEKKALLGHLGTHFDVMDKEFPLEYTRRQGIIFDVSSIGAGEVQITDINLSRVTETMFVAFYSGYLQRVGYGGSAYFKEHPQLSQELIHALLEKRISLIGVDFAGIRRGREHTPADMLCANHGVFVVENLCHLDKLLKQGTDRFIAATYPLHADGITGLPCRVIAELKEEGRA